MTFSLLQALYYRIAAFGNACISARILSLQESVYLGIPGQVRRSQQIVVAGATRNGEGQVKWALGRLADDK